MASHELPINIWKRAVRVLLNPKRDQKISLHQVLAELSALRFPIRDLLAVEAEKLLEALATKNLTTSPKDAERFCVFATNLLYHQEVSLRREIESLVQD